MSEYDKSSAANISTSNSCRKYTNNGDVKDSVVIKVKEIFSKSIRNGNDLEYSLSLIKKYEIIKECYQKAEHYIKLASNSLSVFSNSEEKSILENLTSFSLSRNF